MNSKVLLVEDNQNFRKMLELHLKRAEFEYDSFATGEKAMESFNRDIYSLGVFDLKLPGMDGIELLKKILNKAPDFPVIIITAYGDIETAVRAVKLGAWDFIQKPFDPDELIKQVKNLLKEQKVFRDKEYRIIGNSEEMQNAIELAKKAAPTDTTVLLLGESGTGKELFARAIHRWSGRGNRAFVALNTAAIPETLLESELFGIEKGTATGVEKRMGKIEQAHKGTLFLDEIGDMPLSVQAKLLRVIEDKKFQRVGGRETKSGDVRIICATNQNLKKLVNKDEFREDLYYRLNVFPIHLPPLRDRKDDIDSLIDYYVNIYSQKMKKNIKNIEEKARFKLKNYRWKGNVRELENVLTRAILLADDDIIKEKNIIFSTEEETPGENLPLDLKEIVNRKKAKAEIKIIKEALKQTGGNKKKAAKLLNISYKTLFNKLNEYEIL